VNPIVLLAPSMAAAMELPRRLAAAGRAVALYRFPEPGRDHYRSGVLDLARAVAEPELLGKGLAAWDAGHDARLAARLLDEDRGGGLPLPGGVPRGPVAAALARTLEDLRQAGVPPDHLEALADRARDAPEDQARLRALARLFRAFEAKREGQVADPGSVLRAAAGALPRAAWLQRAEVLIVEDLELDEREKEFLAAVARRFPVRLLRRDMPPSLDPSSFRAWARDHGIAEVGWEDTVLAPLAPPPPAPGLLRLRTRLFEPPQGGTARDEAIELVTAPGEAGEVRALTRRLLREAGRGVAFEDMGVILPRADRYAPLFSDLFERLGIPFQLHPSLPLRSGRLARSLLLLFRSRGLLRASVMEFLTFAPIPFGAILGREARAEPSRWDQISRDARIVSGLDRWQAGLLTHAGEERTAADRESDAERAGRRRRSAEDAEACLRVVEALAADLDRLDGEATWPDWSERLNDVAARWLAPPPGAEREWEAVLRVVDALAGLGRIDARVVWSEVEAVVEARFESRRMPLAPPAAGAIHVGALDAMAGLPFRVVAVPGLVEGGYPGVLRPDPFLLDAEREALAEAPPPPGPGGKGPAQLALFGPEEKALATTQDRLREARRLFSRALGQATDRLILSYPRADPRSGRERMPSLFFASAASALEGKPLSSTELQGLVTEDEPRDVDDAIDAGERDRRRMLQEPRAAADAIAAGSLFFRQSRWAVQGRLANRLTAYDGFLGSLDEETRRRLDPVASAISASRLATFSRCGFQYLLQYVLRLPPTLEPEERRKLEPLERGDLFHRVAERFLREMRDEGRLPVKDTEETRERLAEMGEEALSEHVAGSPPRFRALWDREKRRFHATLGDWLRREAWSADKSTPAHFEVGFGLPMDPAGGGEPHDPRPLEVDLGDGRTLRVQGKIDRIDRREDGGLVLRDYKTGKAPRDEGGLFRGGKQLQVPFYILAVEKLFPDARVVDAFLDYVDGGRQVAVDVGTVRSEGFRKMLRELVDLVGRGVFVQEPSVCDWCDYTAVCGPKGLLMARRRFKVSDPELQRALQARNLG
jgi:ATP-dependent helicase/nuclease subunit B